MKNISFSLTNKNDHQTDQSVNILDGLVTKCQETNFW